MVWYRVKQGGLKIHCLMEVILNHALNFLIGRKKKTQRFGIENVVELGDHGFQNLVLHKEDHGCHGRWGETTMVWVGGILVVVVGYG